MYVDALCMYVAFCTFLSSAPQICDLVGPHVCMVKTHVDIVEDFSIDRWMELQRIASEHRFLIMEDRLVYSAHTYIYSVNEY